MASWDGARKRADLRGAAGGAGSEDRVGGATAGGGGVLKRGVTGGGESTWEMRAGPELKAGPGTEGWLENGTKARGRNEYGAR